MKKNKAAKIALDTLLITSVIGGAAVGGIVGIKAIQYANKSNKANDVQSSEPTKTVFEVDLEKLQGNLDALVRSGMVSDKAVLASLDRMANDEKYLTSALDERKGAFGRSSRNRQSRTKRTCFRHKKGARKVMRRPRIVKSVRQGLFLL